LAISPSSTLPQQGLCKAILRLLFYRWLSTLTRIVKANVSPGLREIVVTRNYIVLYRVTTSAVGIVNVVHGARQFPLS
jgi:plasmid stabilization system protein ParE